MVVYLPNDGNSGATGVSATAHIIYSF